MVYWMWDGCAWRQVEGVLRLDCRPYVFVDAAGVRIEIPAYSIGLRAPKGPPTGGETLWVVYVK